MLELQSTESSWLMICMLWELRRRGEEEENKLGSNKTHQQQPKSSQTDSIGEATAGQCHDQLTEWAVGSAYKILLLTTFTAAPVATEAASGYPPTAWPTGPLCGCDRVHVGAREQMGEHIFLWGCETSGHPVDKLFLSKKHEHPTSVHVSNDNVWQCEKGRA